MMNLKKSRIPVALPTVKAHVQEKVTDPVVRLRNGRQGIRTKKFPRVQNDEGYEADCSFITEQDSSIIDTFSVPYCYKLSSAVSFKSMETAVPEVSEHIEENCCEVKGDCQPDLSKSVEMAEPTVDGSDASSQYTFVKVIQEMEKSPNTSTVMKIMHLDNAPKQTVLPDFSDISDETTTLVDNSKQSSNTQSNDCTPKLESTRISIMVDDISGDSKRKSALKTEKSVSKSRSIGSMSTIFVEHEDSVDESQDEATFEEVQKEKCMSTFHEEDETLRGLLGSRAATPTDFDSVHDFSVTNARIPPSDCDCSDSELRSQELDADHWLRNTVEMCADFVFSDDELDHSDDTSMDYSDGGSEEVGIATVQSGLVEESQSVVQNDTHLVKSPLPPVDRDRFLSEDECDEGSDQGQDSESVEKTLTNMNINDSSVNDLLGGDHNSKTGDVDPSATTLVCATSRRLTRSCSKSMNADASLSRNIQERDESQSTNHQRSRPHSTVLTQSICDSDTLWEKVMTAKLGFDESSRFILAHKLLNAIFLRVFNKSPSLHLEFSWRLKKNCAQYAPNRCNANEDVIRLSSKAITTAPRLAFTLIHHVCHWAAKRVSGAGSSHSGHFKSWARRCDEAFSTFPPIRESHELNEDENTDFSVVCDDCEARVSSSQITDLRESVECRHRNKSTFAFGALWKNVKMSSSGEKEFYVHYNF